MMMKRLLLLCLVGLVGSLDFVRGADIYVSPQGNDTHAGTLAQPLQTLAAAIRKAREIRRLQEPGWNNGIHIIMREGVYRMTEPAVLLPEDAGYANSPTIIEAALGEQPILSGGISINSWKKSSLFPAGLPIAAKEKIWEANMPEDAPPYFLFRQLWVNGQKAQRAQDAPAGSMQRILQWNKQTQSCKILLPKAQQLEVKPGLEMLLHQWWAIANLRIKKIARQADTATLYFHSPESKVQSEHPWPAPWISQETGNSAYLLLNAIEFLNEPGEWFYDAATRKLYYWPRAGEDLKTAEVIAPSQETLLQFKGNADHPITHIQVKGLHFQYTGWIRPSLFGHVPHQAGLYMLEAYRLKIPGTPDKASLENQAWVGRPAAAMQIEHARNIAIEDCSFEHLASTGIDVGAGVKTAWIRGNLLRDIGGNGLLLGTYSSESSEIHLPYQPKEERDITENLYVENNLIQNATQEDWGTIGIGIGYTRNTHVTHNEIAGVSYTGISMGWGWSPTANVMSNNSIERNYIHHYGRHMYDCSGIYTLSAQPASFIQGNRIDSIYKAPYAHLPQHWFYLYCDEGSSGFTVKDNWTPAPRFLQNANGLNNVWTNNGPQVATTILNRAGIEPSFTRLQQERRAFKAEGVINEDKPLLLECVMPLGKEVNLTLLKVALQKSGVDTNAIYVWKNRAVVFARIPDVYVTRDRLKSLDSNMQVKLYDDLFYEFNRNKCEEEVKRNYDWEHIILTTNLVADKKKQAEYLKYHQNQFKDWPEVSKGFCNASFQQLLLFKNGRQLMLVISIPKGETLDHLNPKTTENNPRVNEWNKLMGPYQEGVEGTGKGEKWVHFERLLRELASSVARREEKSPAHSK